MSPLEDYLNVDHFYLINRLLLKLIDTYRLSFILTSYFIAVRNTRKEYRP